MAGVSSVNRHRIHTYQVNRKNNNVDVAQVDRLQPVNPVQNNTANANDNFAMFSENFYGKLVDLKDCYRRFYQNEQSLDDLMDHFKKQTNDAIPLNIKELIIELVDKYNITYRSLLSFEKEIGLQHSRRLVKTLQKYEIHLNRLGMSILSSGELRVDLALLERSLHYHPEYLHMLFQKNAGLLYELNHALKAIQAHPNHSQFQQIKDAISDTIARGSIVDEKS